MAFRDSLGRSLLFSFPVVAVFVLGMVLGFVVLSGPAGENGEGAVVRIESGQSTSDIARRLRYEGLINSRIVFDILARLTGQSDRLQSGVYEIDPGMTTWEILDTMASGRTATVKVTVPEGYTVSDIADLLVRQMGADETILLRLAEEGDFDYHFLPEEPYEGQFRLEGYLYPETYHFPIDAGEYELLDRMLGQFADVYESHLRERLVERTGDVEPELDLHRVLTLASIVEKEAQIDSERARIAGVFYNRLAQGKLLQSDPTVEYALGFSRLRLLYADLGIDSPYNTYLYPDLPPGPITNPGLNSILATLEPEEHEYFFFVSREDGTHAFTRTYEEHLYYREKYQR